VIDDRAAGWLLALAFAAMLVAGSERGRRGDAWAAVSLLALYLIVLAGSQWLMDDATLAPLVAAAAVWLALQPMLGLGRLTRAELRLAPLKAGSARPVMIAIALALAANALAITMRGPPPMPVTARLLAAVSIAAVIEELVMRGAILAYADRAWPPRWRIASASIGPGGLLVTAAFVALHGIRPGLLLGVLPAALLYLWLRARSGSLAPPIVAHALWNLSVVLLHR